MDSHSFLLGNNIRHYYGIRIKYRIEEIALEVSVKITSPFVLNFHCLLVYENHALSFVSSKYSLKLTKNGIPFVT